MMIMSLMIQLREQDVSAMKVQHLHWGPILYGHQISKVTKLPSKSSRAIRL